MDAMARPLRHVPEKTTLMEVTNKTIGDRFLLKPTKELEGIILGIIGRAQRMYPLLIHDFVFMSNHYHMLLTPGSAKRLRDFMTFVNSNIAREAARLVGWKGRFWARRYKAIPVSHEDVAQIERLRYILSHGCKEGLVASSAQWPGAKSVTARLEGRRLKGLWLNRTAAHNARMRGEDVDDLAFAEEEEVILSPLPCWAHLSPGQYRECLADLVSEITKETARQHQQGGTEPAGVPYVLAQHYEDRPRKPRRSPAPLVHAYAKAVRESMVQAYRAFYNAFRAAADALEEGTRDAQFPDGSFPPGRPFVGPVPELVPG